MDAFTTLIVVLIVITILSVFLACIPVFIIISMMLNNQQQQMTTLLQEYQLQSTEQFQKNQEWTITAIAQLSEHHSETMQQIMVSLFSEMKRLSGKIPVVSATPPSKQITSPIQKLPAPSPVLMTIENSDGGKD